MKKVKNFKAWFYSNQSLESIGAIIQKYPQVIVHEYDCENIYEWLSITYDQHFHLNVSRKHNDFIDYANEAISILVIYENQEPQDEIVIDFSHYISQTLNCRVKLGHINHTDDDNFVYEEIGEIQPTVNM